jgi:hypothetical protein
MNELKVSSPGWAVKISPIPQFCDQRIFNYCCSFYIPFFKINKAWQWVNRRLICSQTFILRGMANIFKIYCIYSDGHYCSHVSKLSLQDQISRQRMIVTSWAATHFVAKPFFYKSAKFH